MTERSRKKEENCPKPVLDDSDLEPPPLPKRAKRSTTPATTQTRKTVKPSSQDSRKTLIMVCCVSGSALMVLSVLLFLQLQSNPRPAANPDLIGKNDVKLASPGLDNSSTDKVVPGKETSKDADGRLASRVSSIVENPRNSSVEESGEMEPNANNRARSTSIPSGASAKPERPGHPSASAIANADAAADSKAVNDDEKMTDEEKMTDAEKMADEEKTAAANPQPESPLKVNDTPAIAKETSANQKKEDLDTLISLASSLIKTAQGEDAAERFKDAATTLRKASNLYPKDIRGDFYLGLMHSGIGVNNYKIADQHFKRALDRSPGHIPTMNNLALVAIKAHKFPVARNYLTQLAKLTPRPSETNQNLGRLLGQSKFFDIKSDELKRITLLNTESAAYRPDYGWMYMPLDGTEKSLTEYKGFCRDGILEDCSCSVCNGFGSVPCKTCGKEGSVLVMGTMSGTVTTLYGSVNTSTPTSASVRCGTCGGLGRVDCNNCRDGKDPSLRQRR